MYDLIIIGGGPAGASAGVYAARKKIKTLLITPDFGGQSSVSADVQNYVGIVSLPGMELAERFKKHLEAYAADILEIKEGPKVTSVKKTDDGFEVITSSGESLRTKTVLVCSGSSRRKLKVPGADRLDNRGISYCATCDAPLFSGKDVVVIGGGNAGFESAEQLLTYCPSVILLEFGDIFKADPVTVDRVLKNPKFKGFAGAETVEIKGENMVEGLVWKDRKTGETHNMKVGGVFVEIGAIPNSDFVKDLVGFNKIGEIVVDHKTQRSSQEGIWAAGDVSDVLYKQNNISMGDAVKALEDIYLYLQKNK